MEVGEVEDALVVEVGGVGLGVGVDAAFVSHEDMTIALLNVSLSYGYNSTWAIGNPTDG